jgi:crotonobetainyl-CoA:carnitine CoA-transferase CaiB-like acyl-CoA transferase
MEPHRPLEGYRIVDMSSVVMGPLATEILADLGAQVVAVERPGGDPNRAMGAGPHPDLSGQALNLMRGRRSIVLDIGHPDGREVLERLVAASDVFITNLRPASRRRARIRDGDLRSLRPDLIYCAATGFATDDPRADDPAYDDIIQSAAPSRRSARSAIRTTMPSSSR